MVNNIDVKPKDTLLSEAQFDLVDDYLCRLVETIEQMPRDQIYAVIEVLFNAWKHGKRIFICGNGGSAATASHMVNDLSKLTIVEGQERIKAIGLNDNVSLMTAWCNDTAYENIFAEQLRNLVAPGDVVIGISTSGNSPSILQTMKVARDYHAICVGLTGADGGYLKEIVDYCIHIPDPNTARQEDGHMILDHIFAITLRRMIAEESNSQ